MIGFMSFVAVICLVTAALDMGMNGAGYAGWAPYGVGIAMVLLVITLFLPA